MSLESLRAKMVALQGNVIIDLSQTSDSGGFIKSSGIESDPLPAEPMTSVVVRTSTNGSHAHAPEHRPRNQPHNVVPMRGERASGLQQRVTYLPDVHRLLPQSPDAERALLGSILLLPDEVMRLCAAKGVTASQFHIPAHALIYETVEEMWREGDTGVDLVTLTQKLIDRGQLIQLGETEGHGAAFIAELYGFIGTAANAGYYIEIVLEKATLRAIILAGTEAAARAYDEQENVHQLAQFAYDQFKKITDGRKVVKSKLTVRTLGEIWAMEFDEADNYFGDRIFAEGQACTLLGPGGIGKSRMAMQLAISMIIGRDFLGMPTRASDMSWLFIQTENSNRRLRFDSDLMKHSLRLTAQEIERVKRHLFIHTIETDEDAFLNLTDPENYNQVNILVQDYKPKFVMFDPLNSVTDEDLNNDRDMRAACIAISRITKSGDPTRCPFVLHHSLTGKAGAAKAVGFDKGSYGRNSKVLFAWTRAQINLGLRSPDDPNELIMACGKNNNGKQFPEIGVRFNEVAGIYEVDPTFDADVFREDVGLKATKKKTVRDEDVAALVEDGIPRSKLKEAVMIKCEVSKNTAYRAIDGAIERGKLSKEKGKNWDVKIYKINPARSYHDKD